MNLSCALVELAAFIANAPNPAANAATPATNAPVGVSVITAFNAPIAEPVSIAIETNEPRFLITPIIELPNATIASYLNATVIPVIAPITKGP